VNFVLIQWKPSDKNKTYNQRFHFKGKEPEEVKDYKRHFLLIQWLHECSESLVKDWKASWTCFLFLRHQSSPQNNYFSLMFSEIE